MAEQLQLRVVTPQESVLDAAVEEVTGPGTIGEFGVLPNHAAFLTTLEIGCVSYKRGGKPGHIVVRGGFAEVADNVMTVLADAAQPAEEIDTVLAESDLQAATLRLKELSPIDPDYPAVDADQRWAEARLEVAKRK